MAGYAWQFARMIEELTFLGGLLLGLASTPHCAAMCGGIASTITFCASPGAERPLQSRARTLMLAQLGKSLSYIAAGALVGGLGTTAYGVMDQSTAFSIMQWLAAMTLIAIGFSLAGVVPFLGAIARLSSPISNGLHRVVAMGTSATSSLGVFGGPILTGMIWGFLPCGMVYAALFAAMLAGNPLNAAVVMAGFAIGVMPGVTAAALGVALLPRFARGDTARVVIGLTIAGLGLASAMLAGPNSSLWCAPPN